MVLLTGAVGKDKPATLKLQALHGWGVLVQALLDHAPAQLANAMHQVLISIALRHILLVSCYSDEHQMVDSNRTSLLFTPL
jgi:hypothetical protein